MSIIKRDYFWKKLMHLIIIASLVVGSLGGILTVKAQTTNVIETLWSDHTPIITKYDWNNDFDWSMVIDDLFADEGIYKNPRAFEDNKGALWLTWESSELIFIAKLNPSDIIWRIQSVIKNETSILSDAHFYQDPDGTYWIVHCNEAKSGYQSLLKPTSTAFNQTNITGNNWTKPTKLIYITNSLDGINWNPPICVTPNASSQHSNPWMIYAKDKYWLVWDTNLYGKDWDLEVSYSENGVNWSEPIPILNDDDDNDYDPSLLFFQNEFLLVWVSNEFDEYAYVGSGEEDLVTYSTSKNGLDWSAPQPIQPRYCDEASPYLTVDSIGRILLIWSSDRMDFEEEADERDHDKDIWYSTYAAGDWSVPTPLTTESANDASPSLLQSGTNRYWAIWEHDSKIFYSTCDNLPPPINAFGSDIYVPVDKWKEEFDETYEGEILKTFDIYNYGERDLKGTITASHGFTTNRYEFFITPGENVSFTISLNARDEGRYLGVAEIISNDEIAPRISIPIYIKITSHPFEGEGIIPEGLEIEEEEEDEKEDLSILLGMISALIIIFILIFIFSQSKEGKKKRPKAVKKELKKLEKEKRPPTKKRGVKKDRKEVKKVDQEKKPPIKKEDAQKVKGRKDIKKKDTKSLKIPKFNGKKGLTGSLIIIGAIFCGFLIISSSFASSINILATAQSNDSTNSNETKIYSQTPKEYVIWVPYYDINGNESEREMHAEFFDSDLKSFPPSWIEYGSTLSLKQLIEVPFPVEKLRFWMKYVDGGGPICIKLMKNVTGDQGAPTEYFWVDYDSTSYGWCEVNISASKIANVIGGGSYYVQLTPPLDIVDGNYLRGINQLGIVTQNSTLIPGAQSVEKTLYDVEIESDGAKKYSHIFWESKIDDSVEIDVDFAYNYNYNNLNPIYLTDSDWNTTDFNLKMELLVKAEMFSEVGIQQPTYPGYEDSEIEGTLKVINPFQDAENFTVRVGILGPDGTEYSVLKEDHRIKYADDLEIDYTYLLKMGALTGEYYIVAGIYLTDISENGAPVMVDKWGDTVEELEKTRFAVINTTPIQDVKLVDKLPQDVDGNNIPVYYLKCSDAPGHRPPPSVRIELDEVETQLEDLESVLGVEFEHRDIQNTREFLELIDSNISNAIVINYHGDILPIPSSFVRGEDIGLNTIIRYHFDENNGTKVYDQSKYLNDATFVGDPQWTIERQEGISALHFDGIDDMIKIENDLSLQSSTFTIQFWLYLKKEYSSGVHTILSRMDQSDGYEINLNQSASSSSNRLEFAIKNNSTWHQIPGMSIDTEKWYKITGVFNVTKASLYVSWQDTVIRFRREITVQMDELQGEIDVGGISYIDAPLIIGGSILDNNKSTEMNIDNLEITSDVRLPSEYIQGNPEDGINWIKRIGKWIAENNIVFVNTRYSPFQAVGNVEQNWRSNEITIGPDGFSSLLRTRSIDSTRYKDTWLEGLRTDITEDAIELEQALGGWGHTFNNSIENGRTYMTLAEDFDNLCIPLYKTANGELTHAMIFYGKGAIMFNGLGMPEASLIAGVSGWYIANNIRPLYFIDCEDATKSGIANGVKAELQSVFDRLQADTGIQFYYKTISSTLDLVQLIQSNLKDVIVVNTHGDVLPLPEKHITGSNVDDYSCALWKFEEGKDDLSFDSSGTYKDGKILGDNWKWTTNSHFGDYALDFSGTGAGDYVLFNPMPDLSDKQFTLECSLYLQQDYINKTATILSNELQLSSKPGEEYTHTYGYALTVNYKDHLKSNRLVFSLGTGLPDREVIYYDSLQKNNWYRIAASYDGTYMKLYVNYEEVASKEAIGLHPDTPNNLQIGKCPTWDYPINAIIDDVHISEGARSPDRMLIDIVSHGEWFEELNNWIAENGIIWVGTGGYEFYYLSLKGQNWPNERIPLRSEGLAEFTEVGLPPLELNIANKICTITDIGMGVRNALPKANLPLDVISSRTIPNTHNIFTIPIYSDGDVVSHGVIPIGKGKFIHSGTYNAEIIASTATWLYTNGKVQMVFLIDVPETVGGTEPMVVESQHPYPTKYGTNPNLLTNPGAESGSMSSWNILVNGGNGWKATGGGYEGNYQFLTSYSWCKRNQEIDLLAKGYSTEQLDAAPTIYAEEWFCGSWPNYGDSYYLKIELRDGNHNPIASYDSGTKKATTNWQKLSHTFSDYGSGLRYIYWEDGGDDAEYWRGHYGARLDAAFLTIATAEYEDLWKINKKDVNRMRVHFEKYEVGDEGDYIQLLDKENIEIARYTGFSNSDEWSPWCEGDIIKVKLVTSSNRHFWGFKINQIEYLSSGKSVSHPIGQDEIKSKLTDLESSIDTNCIFRTISSTDQFKDLVESRLEKPLVINLHGNAIPIPESYLTGAVSATTPPLGYSSGGLKGEYYDNEGFTNLKEERIDSEINFDWGLGSPSIDIQGQTFSARWTGKIRIDYSEEYTFFVRTDDGTRMWIDKNQDGDFEDLDELVIDSWIRQPPTEHQGKIKLTPDYYDIKYEYYEHSGNAVAELYWSSKSVSKAVIPGTHLFSNLATPAGYTPGGLEGEYYDNMDLTYLKTTIVDSTINFNWGSDSPDPSVGEDTFSVNWAGKIRIDQPGEYKFFVNTDDGSKLWVNDVLIIDSWIDQGLTEHVGTITFSEPGFYNIKYQYYDNTGTATAKLYWITPKMADGGEGKEIIPSDHLFNKGGIFSYAKEWLNELGDWVARNGVVFANTKDYPFQYAVIDNPSPDSSNLWYIGEDGFDEFISPRAESVSLTRLSEGLGNGNLTANGQALRAYLPSHTLPSYVTGVVYPLPSGYNCIPIYRDAITDDITHAIIPFGRGAYIHCGGFSVEALTTMCFMYASRKSDVQFNGDVYYKGDTIWTELKLKNDNPIEMTYDFELIATYPEEGLRARRMADSQAITLRPGEERTTYLSWTPTQPDKIGTYTLEIQVIDLERHILVEVWGNDVNHDTMEVNVKVGGYISRVKTREHIGFFDTVEIEVTITNEMYVDNLFTVSGIFQHKDTGYIYWTEDEELPEYKVEGDMESTIIVEWHPSQHNYPNQTFELGKYESTMFLEDVASAFCVLDTTSESNKSEYIRIKKILDQNSIEFKIVGQLEINFPTEIGKWSISFHGEAGPFIPIDPQVRNAVRVLDPDYDIWIRRDSRFEYAPELNLNGMFGYWKFDEPSWAGAANEIIDSSDNDFHGTANNGASTVPYAKFGRAASFDGVDDRIKLPRMALHDLDNFSVEFWIMTTDHTAGIISGANFAQNNEYLIYIAGGKIKPHIKGAAILTNLAINDGNWHHLAVVRNGSLVKIYLDSGIPFEWINAPTGSISIDANGLWLAAEQDSVGGSWDTNQQLNGFLDELVIYNRPLSADDINAHYLSGIIEANDKTAFKLGYKSDSGNDLHAVVNFESCEDAKHYQKVLKLPADGTYLEKTDLLAYYWPVGTTLKISQEPTLQFKGTEYYNAYSSIETSQANVECVALTNKGLQVTYDVVMNEANFYKIFITAQNCPKSEAGDIQLRVHLDYWTGNSEHVDAFGNVGWNASKESPQELVWNERNENFEMKELRLKLEPGHYHITLENLHDYNSGDYDKNAYISEIAIRPSFGLDFSPKKVEETSLGGGESSQTRSNGNGNGDTPLGTTSCDLGAYPKKLPDKMMEFLYKNVPIPLFGADCELGSPALKLDFCPEFGIELDFGLNQDVITDDWKAWVKLTIGGKIEPPGLPLKFSYNIAVYLALKNPFNADTYKTGNSFAENLSWYVEINVELKIALLQLISGVPMELKIPAPHSKDDKKPANVFLLKCEFYLVINVVIKLYSGDRADDVRFGFGLKIGVTFEFAIEMTLSTDMLKCLTKKTDELQKKQDKYDRKLEKYSKEMEAAEAKRIETISDAKKNYKTLSYNELNEIYDEGIHGKHEEEVMDKYSKYSKKSMSNGKKLSECNNYKEMFGDINLKAIEKWGITIKYHVDFVAGVFFGINFRVYRSDLYAGHPILIDSLLYLEFYAKFSIGFTIEIKLFWFLKLSLPIEVAVWIDVIFWYNKWGAPHWDDDGWDGQWCFKSRQYLPEDVQTCLLKFPVAVNSGWSVKVLIFKFKGSFPF